MAILGVTLSESCGRLYTVSRQWYGRACGQCLPAVARAAGERVWASQRVRAEVVPFGSACSHYQLAHPLAGDNSQTTKTRLCAASHPYLIRSCLPPVTCKYTTSTFLYHTPDTASSYGSDQEGESTHTPPNPLCLVPSPPADATMHACRTRADADMTFCTAHGGPPRRGG